MTGNEDNIGAEGLRFFGKVCASISHEIRNTLAIINENAGLLEDLSLLAARGAAIDPDRLGRMAETVRRQVRRAEGIVGRMNRFAHSADHPVTAVDLVALVELVVSLAARIADMQKIRIQAVPRETEVSVSTSPFVLENLIWQCLDFAMASVDGERALRLAVEPAAGGARIAISGVGEVRPPETDGFPTAMVRAQCRLLNARVDLDFPGGLAIDVRKIGGMQRQ